MPPILTSLLGTLIFRIYWIHQLSEDYLFAQMVLISARSLLTRIILRWIIINLLPWTIHTLITVRMHSSLYSLIFSDDEIESAKDYV